MMWMGMEMRGRRERKVLRRGVRPPLEGERQSSMREAPEREAVRAERGVKEAISRRGIFGVVEGDGWGSGGEPLRLRGRWVTWKSYLVGWRELLVGR